MGPIWSVLSVTAFWTHRLHLLLLSADAHYMAESVIIRAICDALYVAARHPVKAACRQAPL